MTPEDKLADKRLQKKYGISLSEYNTMLAAQGGVCKICRRPPGKVRLSVDHCHKTEKTKITAEKEVFNRWRATSLIFSVNGLTRAGVVKQVRHLLKRYSVRGILCWRCNSGLQKYSDHPERFEAAAAYLRDFYQKFQEPNENPSPAVVPDLPTIQPGL